MLLAESYATSCGLKLGKPFINAAFYPLSTDNYITIQADSGMPGKNYDYYNEVIQLIKPYLDKNGISIIQLGGGGQEPLIGALNLTGATNISQSAYIVQNALLHLGNDSWLSHVAGAYDTPLVCLYGATTVKNHSPFWANKGKTILLESHRNGLHPSYSPQESPKTVNLIHPEDVAKSVLKLLEIDSNITRETVYIGVDYISDGIELIPDCVINPTQFNGTTIAIRMDYYFDESWLEKNLANASKFGARYRICTDRPINETVLNKYKGSIDGVFYDFKDNYSKEFIETLVSAPMQYSLITDMVGDDLDKAKLDLFDYGAIFQKSKFDRKVLFEIPSFKIGKTAFSSNKFLLSSNKIFLTKFHWEKGTPISSFKDNIAIVEESEHVFENANHYYFFNP